MHTAARTWFGSHTSSARDWSKADLLDWKQRTRVRVSVVIPARNESATVGAIVREISSELAGLVDELVVIDSDSEDDTGATARAAGATVHSAAEIRPELGTYPGKGEALWKSQFVTSGEILVFLDADVTNFRSRFVTGLLGPLLADPEICLVRAFYDRDLGKATRPGVPQGGRVTELTARPLLSLWWPELAGVIQPLAGEWAIRRTLFEQLAIPTGYGVEFATLVDTYSARGLRVIAQVDLGKREHKHQDLSGLAAMATEILAVAESRRFGTTQPTGVEVARFHRRAVRRAGEFELQPVPTAERPPAVDVASPEPQRAPAPAGQAG